MRRSLISLALVAAVSLTACGTTVEGTDPSLSGTQQGLGGTAAYQDPGTSLGAPGSGDGTGAGAGTGTGTGTGTGLPGGTGTGTGTGTDTGAPGDGAPTAPGDGGTTAPTPTGDVGPGVSDDTITIGIPVETGTQAAADAFGISGFSTVSQQAIFEAVIADVNKSGGVLGRELVGAYHEYDVAQALANPAQTVAEICADFSSDRRVLAVMIGIAHPGLRACTADMGSPLWLLNGLTFLSESEWSKDGGDYLYGIDSITTERLAELFVDSLLERDFDEKWNIVSGGAGGVLPTKMGAIHVDTPDMRAQYAAYESQLKARGYSYEEHVTYPQDASAALAATQAAVLRFKSAGITHVFGASIFFLQAAEAQGYRPRYAYLPGLGQVGVDNAPAAQMRGAMTVGWAPASDVGPAKDPGPNPGAGRCDASMKAAGLSTAKREDQRVMYNICDAVYSFAETLKAGKAPNVAGIRVGYESLRGGFRHALTFRSNVGPGKHAGIDSVRDLAYEEACKCLVYTSSRDRS